MGEKFAQPMKISIADTVYGLVLSLRQGRCTAPLPREGRLRETEREDLINSGKVQYFAEVLFDIKKTGNS